MYGTGGPQNCLPHGLLVREKQAALGVQMQEVALKWSEGWLCRCVAFECVGALGKQGGGTGEQFRC